MRQNAYGHSFATQRFDGSWDRIVCLSDVEDTVWLTERIAIELDVPSAL